MRIIISSAGRRVYLVQWFKEALQQADIPGEVYVLDNDPGAAAAAAADRHFHIPAFTDAAYQGRLLELIDELQPDLFISLNDHEITVLSQSIGDELRSRGIVVPILDASAQIVVADKLATYRALRSVGVPTPKTVPLSDAVGALELIESSSDLIIKDRLGSGSSGLLRFGQEQAHQWLNTRGVELIEQDPARLDGLVLQQDLGGIEYGLDIVTPVRGGSVEGILGRRKMRMRHGETSAAITVPTDQFRGVAKALNAALGIRGTIDVDVIVTEDGTPHVIDINPRFGGGYPFCHIAGADIPHFMVASTLGIEPRTGWNTYQHDFLGAKHEGIIGFEPANTTKTPVPARQQPLLWHTI
ncbi:ATP-grasp domain-containing protein [Yaniella halotolerans]|uniref:ATP-grasp domain-containing protein n=1 Tax=Yaniella halotolerans TaxID=225453 RepID=UPI0003B35B7B|nr:ATP-grasp domain-containing protein [Yaniella halotolerans]